jgi:DNA-binding GntR family transcriptional regulator
MTAGGQKPSGEYTSPNTTATGSPHAGNDVHYNRIKNDLLGGVYPPGSILLETALGQRYGVSRTPMREALGRLAQDGFIERSARGFQVRVRSPEEILAIYETRISLESTAAALAAQRRTSFDLARLEHLAELRRQADGASKAAINEDWHRALREAAHNEFIFRFLDQLDSLLAIYRPAELPETTTDPTVEEHDAVLDAIRAKDDELASGTMTKHLIRMRDLRIAGLVRTAQ